MALGFNQVIAPRPVTISVQSRFVANALAIMGSLPREGGDERHIGIDEWVDRVRLSLTDNQLHDVTLIMWGAGIEGLLNAVDHPDADDHFDVFLQELQRLPACKLRDTSLYWLLHSAHRAVYLDATPFPPVDIADLLASRDRFLTYLNRNITRDVSSRYIEEIVDLYFDPDRFKALSIRVLSDLWQDHFEVEWTRQQSELDRVVDAFSGVDTSGMATFEALQVITGRDLRPIFRPDKLSDFEQIICIPSKHNGPYVIWFGNHSTLNIIFTARMPSTILLADHHEPDVNILIQRFKALSDENRMQVLLAIREQHELSTQDIIEQFDLNKSAASRYLGQLYANGFIQERRDTDGKTKYYSVNNNVINEFLQSIAHLLQP